MAPPSASLEVAEIGRIVRKLLDTDREGGYQSAATVAADLRAAAGSFDEPHGARPSTGLTHRWLIVLVLLGAAVVMWALGLL